MKGCLEVNHEILYQYVTMHSYECYEVIESRK